MCQRQIVCGASPTSVCKHVFELIDILVAYAGDGNTSSNDTSSVAWNLLGAIGITQTRYKPSPRAKFLSISLAYYLLHQITVCPEKRDISDQMEDKERGLPILRIAPGTPQDKW